MRDPDDILPTALLVEQEPPLEVDFAFIANAGRRSLQRRNRIAMGCAIVLTCAIAAGGLFIGRSTSVPPLPAAANSSPAPTVNIAGTKWTLAGIDHNGKEIVSRQQLTAAGLVVHLEFRSDGIYLMGDGACNTESGKYSVNSNTLDLLDYADGAVGCEYTSAETQRVSIATAQSIHFMVEAKRVTIVVNSAQLSLALGDGSYSYTYVKVR